MIDLNQLFYLLLFPAGGMLLGLWALLGARKLRVEQAESGRIRSAEETLQAAEATLEKAEALVERAQRRPVHVVMRQSNSGRFSTTRRHAIRAHKIPAE